MGKPIASVAGGRQSVLLGLGVHRPERVVTNDEICELIDSTDEWIQTRSGIKSRRFSGEGEGILAMSISAARKALDVSGIAPEQIGAVIIATSTWDLQTPQAASIVAHELRHQGSGCIRRRGRLRRFLYRPCRGQRPRSRRHG